ncbi:nucleotidyltransferase family protein [Endozoicomonadaceae bacterium StTr2]
MLTMAETGEELVTRLIRQDTHRMQILAAVSTLKLPDCWVAAGFVRNRVWDYLHGYQPTTLNDVDVVYFDSNNPDPQQAQEYQAKLQAQMPEVIWEVKNQAAMHQRNGHAPYSNTADAMSYWPECETAVGVRLKDDGEIELIAPFGVQSLVSGHLTYNVRRERALFESRIERKQWLQHWPKLQVVYP